VPSWLGGNLITIDEPQSLKGSKTDENKSLDPQMTQINADKTETG
jgi:hypothetical protein